MRKTVLSIVFLTVAVLAYFSSCQSNVSIRMAQYAVNGQKLYKTHCANCHGSKGEGLGKLYPPLTDKIFLTENRERLSCIVRHGLHEEIEVAGSKYDQPMPENKILTELDIAYILTYVTTNFAEIDSAYTHEEVKSALTNCR